jgi:histidine ammonia-lyase
MGTIAARDAERICTLTERVVAIHLLTAAQAYDIRNKIGARPLLSSLMEKIRSVSAPVVEDRAMDKDIENICTAIKYSDFFKIKQ